VMKLLRQDSLAESVESVVCYGIGNFSRARTSQYQLALLLAIRAELTVCIFLFSHFIRTYFSRFPRGAGSSGVLYL